MTREHRAEASEENPIRIPEISPFEPGKSTLIPFERGVNNTAGNGNGPKPFISSLRSLRPLTGLFSDDLAVDLGTANTRVYAHGQGIVVDEPSAVAVNKATGEIKAVGKEAWIMMGRTPRNMEVVPPLRNGVIADFRLAEAMLEYFIRKAHQRATLVHPRIIVAVPSDITEVERRAALEAAYRAKATEVHLLEKPMLAAIGAGLPVSRPTGSMIVDLGGGTTEVAVISANGIVNSISLRVGGKQMDEAIVEQVRKQHHLAIGELAAESLKIEIGSAAPLNEPRMALAKGRDVIEDVPKAIPVADSEIREALKESVEAIVRAIRTTLEGTPPELASDIMEHGIVLTGGGALLRNPDRRIREGVGLPVVVAGDPLRCVALGAGRMLQDFALVERLAVA